MPKLKNATPKYRKHKATGQAVVTIAGKDHYLGPHGTKTSKVEYDRLIGEWLAAGRPTRQTDQHNDISITELAAAYLKFAKRYYRKKDGTPTDTIYGVKVALRWLKQYYGKTDAEDFGLLALKALRQRLIEEKYARRYVNETVDKIRRAFKWGVSEELVSASVYQALKSVDGRRKGRSAAKEMPPIKPAVEAVVSETLEKLPAVVADMVRFQRLTGCRPGEICILRPLDVKTDSDVWQYKPKSHKTEHHGRERVILIPRQGRGSQRADF